MTPEEIKQHLKQKYKDLEADADRFKHDLDARYNLHIFETVPLLYQYTNTTGLKGMITEGELWATNLAYCNDSSEFHYGLGKYIEAVKASIITHSGSMEARVATELVERLQQKDRSDTYIYCLTRHNDQLSQWRGYGDHGYGYAVGFDFDRVTKLHGVAIHSWLMYNKIAQEEMCARVGVSLVSDLIKSLPAEDVENAISDIADIVMEDISTGLPFFKHPAFSEEGEYRLFSSVAELAWYQHVKNFPVFIREGQNMLIPYVKLSDWEKGKKTILPIREIIVGPKTDFNKAEQSIRLLLKNNSYPEDITIRRSEIPFV